MADKVLVIGSGGREHALAKAISRFVDVYCAPGNGGTAVMPHCENVPIPATASTDLLDFAMDRRIDLTVVGPEDPLAGGITNLFESEDIPIFGPTYRGAKLEASKAFAKDFMRREGIPTADYITFTDPKKAHEYVDAKGPVYVKASGLALGKGAVPGMTREEAHDAIERMMVKKEFGDAGKEVVIEELLEGEEASIMALINPVNLIVVPFLPSQDHKRLEDGDRGLNTGGMGAYAPTSLITPDIADDISSQILRPTVEGLYNRDTRFAGTLYPGIMVTANGPKVLEFNVRFGDPETQPVLTLLRSDLYEAFQNLLAGDLESSDLKWKPGYAVCVVAASGGYPGKYEKGKEISGLNKEGQLDGLDDVTVYHAGTQFRDGKFYTSGGRVLGVTAVGETMQQARDRAYGAMDRIHFDGMVFRKDIGHRELARLASK